MLKMFITSKKSPKKKSQNRKNCSQILSYNGFQYFSVRLTQSFKMLSSIEITRKINFPLTLSFHHLVIPYNVFGK